MSMEGVFTHLQLEVIHNPPFPTVPPNLTVSEWLDRVQQAYEAQNQSLSLTYRPMSYIDEIAEDIWDIAGGSESSQYPEDEASLWLGYAVLCLAKGTETTSRDVHDAWSAWATVQYDGCHRSLIPFEELTHDVRGYDDLYRDAIHQVARERNA